MEPFGLIKFDFRRPRQGHKLAYSIGIRSEFRLRKLNSKYLARKYLYMIETFGRVKNKSWVYLFEGAQRTRKREKGGLNQSKSKNKVFRASSFPFFTIRTKNERKLSRLYVLIPWCACFQHRCHHRPCIVYCEFDSGNFRMIFIYFMRETLPSCVYRIDTHTFRLCFYFIIHTLSHREKGAKSRRRVRASNILAPSNSYKYPKVIVAQNWKIPFLSCFTRKFRSGGNNLSLSRQ